MKIYTRTGDNGTTGLFGGPRVTKNDPRIEAYGTVDELNSYLGLVCSYLDEGRPEHLEFIQLVQSLQHDLFVVGGDLATPLTSRVTLARVDQKHVEQIERAIDRFDGDLPELKYFVIPGGTRMAATLHVARTVCRRAERLVVEAAALLPLNEFVQAYLNRLSDLLFVLARWANHIAGVEDVKWIPEKP